MASLFNRLFHKKNTPVNTPKKPESNSIQLEPDQAVTTIENLAMPAVSIHGKPHLEVPQLIVGVAQAMGIQRDHNEDSLFTLTTNLLGDEGVINFGLYIIADGMGGHENGELASRLAVDGLVSHVINHIYLPLISSTNSKHDFSLHEVMLSGVMQAHQSIKKVTDGGGTTLTAALILGNQLTLTHVGDSRAYYIDPLGSLKLMTRDHTLVKRLVEIGQITADEALSHPQRNVLYRALGQGEPFEPDISSMQVCPGCHLLICSDGLWGSIPDENLVEAVFSATEPQFICQSLIESAYQAGGLDDISVIIVRIPG